MTKYFTTKIWSKKMSQCEKYTRIIPVNVIHIDTLIKNILYRT